MDRRGAPKGNKFALGNKGGGRKSAFQENAEYELLHRVFFTEEFSAKEIQELVRGRRNIFRRMVIGALTGNERYIIEMFKKLFPDNINVRGLKDQKSMEEVEADVQKILSGKVTTKDEAPPKKKKVVKKKVVKKKPVVKKKKVVRKKATKKKVTRKKK